MLPGDCKRSNIVYSAELGKLEPFAFYICGVGPSDASLTRKYVFVTNCFISFRVPWTLWY